MAIPIAVGSVESRRPLQAAELASMIREGETVRLDGVAVEGDLDLDGVEYPHRLTLTNTVFLGHVRMNEARFAHTVDLSGCELRQNLSFFAARALHGAEIGRGLRICPDGAFRPEILGGVFGTSPRVIPGLGLRHDAYALVISAISWVLVPLFLAGLTGIVRKRQ